MYAPKTKYSPPVTSSVYIRFWRATSCRDRVIRSVSMCMQNSGYRLNRPVSNQKNGNKAQTMCTFFGMYHNCTNTWHDLVSLYPGIFCGTSCYMIRNITKAFHECTVVIFSYMVAIIKINADTLLNLFHRQFSPKWLQYRFRYWCRSHANSLNVAKVIHWTFSDLGRVYSGILLHAPQHWRGHQQWWGLWLGK